MEPTITSPSPNGVAAPAQHKGNAAANGSSPESSRDHRVQDSVRGGKTEEAYKEELSIFFRLAREQRGLLVLTVVAALLGAVFEGIGLGLLVPFLESVTEPQGLERFTGWAWLDGVILGQGSTPFEQLIRVAVIIMGVIVLRGAVSLMRAVMEVRLTEGILHSLRERAARQLLSVSIRFFSTQRMGHILNTVTTEIQRARTLYNIALNAMVQAFLLVAYLAVIFALSWQMAALTFVLCGGLFAIVNPILRRLYGRGRDITAASEEVAAGTTELVGGIRTIITSGAQDYEFERFRRLSADAARTVIAATWQSARVGPLSQIFGTAMILCLVVVAVRFFVWEGELSTARLLVFLFATFRLMPLVQALNGRRAEYFVVRGSLGRISDLLSREGKPYLTDGELSFEGLREGIVVRDVSFSYEPGATVLHDIDLTIPRGSMTAIVGASGAGKSTLVDLIARLYDPSSGEVLVDGRDLRAYSLSSLRSRMAVVSQDTYLFNDTVRFNIAYGLDGVTDEQVAEAAARANALDFIRDLPLGFDTVLGDRGVRLSGGQRQRIAIARALLRDPEILILDEATSALDSVSEQLVQESLDTLMQGRTAIVIAHRLSTVVHADQVVVLEKGRIAEQGTYQELVDRRGQLWVYHELQHQPA